MTPILETERLILRAHTAADLADVHKLWAEPAVFRYTVGTASTRAECWSRILRYAGLWSILGFGYWAVEEKGSSRFVGDVGFGEFLRPVTPSVEGSLEMGWCLQPEFHGQGHAAESVRAALKWARDTFPEMPVTCLIHPDNTKSVQLAVKCGFKQRCVGKFNGDPTLVFDALSAEGADTKPT